MRASGLGSSLFFFSADLGLDLNDSLAFVKTAERANTMGNDQASALRTRVQTRHLDFPVRSSFTGTLS